MSAAAPSTAFPAYNASKPRIASVDLIRGAAMILMAIDHVRVYSGIPPGGPTPAVFFTRWITHFCAPAFIFLAGTSAFFYGRKHRDLSKTLLIRGFWLILHRVHILARSLDLQFQFQAIRDGGSYLGDRVLHDFDGCIGEITAASSRSDRRCHHIRTQPDGFTRGKIAGGPRRQSPLWSLEDSLCGVLRRANSLWP